jgi:hypothetical protein
MGSTRPVPPSGKAFSVIHITGNPRLPSAEGEATWRISDPGLQNSATFFVNRDGSVVQTLGDPLHMDPWANGDVDRPDLSNRRIAAMVADKVNANTRTLVAIENVGYEPGSSITEAQIRTNAKIIAHYHKAAGVPINRTTVIGHYQLNSVSRPNCPGKDKSVIDRIVALANDEGEDPVAIAALEAEVREYKELAAKRLKRIRALEDRKDALLAEVVELETELAAAAAAAEDAEGLRARVNRLLRRITGIKEKIASLATEVADD